MSPRLPHLRRLCPPRWTRLHHRPLTILSIETSCDDTSVALLDTPTPTTASLLFHKTVTSPNRATGGIHPLLSLNCHRQYLAPLLQDLISAFPLPPDVVAVTRGPGMVASLAVGLDTAKGLATAWNRPLIGVNHMLAHALTPRLTAALEGRAGPEFPFLTLLVSGGHTMLLSSHSLTSHAVRANSMDIAVGDMIDKSARAVLPTAHLETQGEAVAYGRLLEEYCFPRGQEDWLYYPPGTPERTLEDAQKPDWQITPPLGRNLPHYRTAFSFSGLGSAVQRWLDFRGAEISEAERRALGREAMMVAFEHIASRVVKPMQALPDAKGTLVVSGGVASNSFLRHLLVKYLENEGCEVELVCPPPKYCTDNAAMIAWAGAEMWRAGYSTELGVMPIRRWSLDDAVPCEEVDERGVVGTGGVLGVRGWIKREF